MSSESYDSRLQAIEQRLEKIEALLSPRREQEQALPQPPVPSGPSPTYNRWKSQQATSAARPAERASIGNILGWGGAIALLLAAAYLIRLAVDSGWLTPMRQVAFAGMFGLALIGSGLLLRKSNPEYAGLLPATGIGVLFLAIYGGHLYHHILAFKDAGVAVIAVCLASLWLCRLFKSELYALFAVAGSYSAPFLFARASGSMTDLTLYFSAWSAVFCAFAIWHGRRIVYLLALYFALIGFDLVGQPLSSEQWLNALFFQLLQFSLFGATTAIFSIRLGTPLSPREALAHLPPLLLFYLLQYRLLDLHLPTLAPWIAVASLAAMAALHGLARMRLKRSLAGGELLLWAYTALILFHAGYLESVPREWGPWAAVWLIPLIAVATKAGKGGWETKWPIWVAAGLIFVPNYLRIIFNTDLHGVPAQQLLPGAYALLLYLAYFFCHRQNNFATMKPLLLYMGHLCTMAAALHLLDEPIMESAAWGLLAIASLGLSRFIDAPLLRQSSLPVFGATAIKVMLYDLSGAAPVARIVGLLVLGFTFYAGGLLYQRLQSQSRDNVPG